MGGGARTSTADMSTSLRTVADADLRAIAAIERAVFSDPWSEASFAGLLGAPRVRMTVADVDDRVAGYSILMLAPPDADLANLAVAPWARGRGLGRALLEHAIDEARALGVEHVYLEVRPSNARALALYEGVGFRAVGVRRRYYRAPVEDARVLRLEVSRK